MSLLPKSAMLEKYNHLEIEAAAQTHWTAADAYRVIENARDARGDL